MTVEASVAIAADNSQLLRVLQESKSAMAEFFVSVTEEGEGLGAMLEDIQGKFTNAFNFAGLTVGIEMIKQVGEAIERMGQKAVELRSMADVLGVTTDQMQAMQEASEHAGVSQETLVRTGERLVTILTEARNGSGAAVEKLLQLGVTTDQINDPMFKLNDLLGVLHDRLTDTATAQATMNELLAVLGNRAGLAAEAIKKYDGSEESVKEVLAAVNGLTAEQNNKLATAGISWAEFSTKVENSSKKALLAMADLGNWMRDHSSTLSALGSSVGAPKSETGASGANPFGATADIAEQQAKEIGELAESLARQQMDANQKAQLAELDNIKQSVAAFREGSAQKLEALQREHALAQEIYGSADIDKVKAIYQQIIAEEKAVYDAGLQADQESTSREDRHVQGVLRGYASQIEANQRYFDEAEQNQKKLDDLTTFSEDLQTRLLKERSQLLEQQRALDQRVANEWYQKWSGVSGAIQSSFSGAISGMIQGTTTFAGAMQNIFSSVIDSVIQMFVKMGIQWAEGLIFQQVSQRAAAVTGITANAGIAATAAMASVAAIPFYGWAMAPEVGASTFAGAIGYLASASAADGFDVPAGMNPVTQLHQREMVLPAPIADTVRNAMGNGGSGGSVNVQFTPVKGGYGLVHMGNLADSIRKLNGRFSFGTSHV